MTEKRRRRWIDANRVRSGDKKLRRYCKRCGTPVTSARILGGLNLCEFCVSELEKARDGVYSCKGCGKVAPEQLKRNKGYCKDCVCPACGRPEPEHVRRFEICSACIEVAGGICRSCGKEALAQVEKNRGLCDACRSRMNDRKRY